ncbi:MAG: sigma factor-like helix-turn-helix DNA-binding protein [Acidimicrobiia bacterium]|nr:sigma factor-like helix-turn-helix DNA-binding protein [Acidimicrobiia bacterium]
MAVRHRTQRGHRPRPGAVVATAGGAGTDGRVGDPATATDAELEALVVSWQVEEAMRRLSDDHRTVLIEVHVRDRSYDDVADELGVPAGTVKSRVDYGLRAPRLALEELGWDDDG